MSFNKALAQLGIAMAALVVNRKDAIVHLEHGNVQPLGRDGHADAFKKIGLGGHVNPVAHIKSGK
jgi:hypothetical protein